MRKIILVLGIFCALWLGIYVVAKYQVNKWIKSTSSEDLELSCCGTFYVTFGYDHLIHIVMKNLQIKVDEYNLNADIKIYPKWSNIIVDSVITYDKNQTQIHFPIISTHGRSKNNNIYLKSFEINDASISSAGADILIKGNIKFYADILPEGFFDIIIKNQYKILDFDLLKHHAKVRENTQYVLDKINSQDGVFRIDYRPNGLYINNIDVESLKIVE